VKTMLLANHGLGLEPQSLRRSLCYLPVVMNSLDDGWVCFHIINDFIHSSGMSYNLFHFQFLHSPWEEPIFLPALIGHMFALCPMTPHF